jgi:hypothetical protein
MRFRDPITADMVCKGTLVTLRLMKQNLQKSLLLMKNALEVFNTDETDLISCYRQRVR